MIKEKITFGTLKIGSIVGTYNEEDEYWDLEKILNITPRPKDPNIPYMQDAIVLDTDKGNQFVVFPEDSKADLGCYEQHSMASYIVYTDVCEMRDDMYGSEMCDKATQFIKVLGQIS